MENAKIHFSQSTAILGVGSNKISRYSEDYNVENFKKMIFTNSLGQEAIICSQECSNFFTVDEYQIQFSLSFTQTIHLSQ